MTENSKNNQKKQGCNWRLIAVYGVALILAAVIVALFLIGNDRMSHDPEETQNNLNVQIQPVQKETYDLGNDLKLLSVGKFAGIYMEDGSNEVVSNIMMIQVENSSDKDLQLCKFKLDYSSFTAEFEATNIPAGQSVVLLEKYRRNYVDEKFVSASVRNVVFFQEKMTTLPEKIEISGLKGTLNVKNISGADIGEDIYIYYKYTFGISLYGGITFRTKVQGGLKADELKQVMTSHFNPDTCVIVDVEYGA